jgi:hypothetical protein
VKDTELIEQAGFVLPFLGQMMGSFPLQALCWEWRLLARIQGPFSLQVLPASSQVPCQWPLASMFPSVLKPTLSGQIWLERARN